MRPLVLVAAVASLIAALFAAGWLGLMLASASGGDAAATATRVPGKTPPSERPRRASAPAWAERASGTCVRSYDQTMNAVDDALFDASGRSPQQITLRLLRRIVEIEERTLARLERLRPRPRAERKPIAQALKLLRQEVAVDRATVASLRRSWQPSLLARRFATSGPANDRLRVLFIGLGAHGCSTLFDADSY